MSESRQWAQPTATPKCGTYAGATDHYRRGEKPCQDCRDARNDYARRYIRDRGGQPNFSYAMVRQYVTGGEL